MLKETTAASMGEDTRFQEMLGRLKQNGLRLTPQRMAIVRILAGSTAHPSVEQIHTAVRQNFPTTSLATVYKTVSMLKEMGEVMELGFGDSRNRYDANQPFTHPHLICTHCRQITDAHPATLHHLAEELARKSGYRILNHRLDFYGICPACQTKEPRTGVT